ncbi:hypothetical protein DIPPA_07023 [Diplonema papillatum]|nr:hypothetical protein DIPPA_07023 [Diplonema papillatum]|eukprot:gene8764-13573_t
MLSNKSTDKQVEAAADVANTAELALTTDRENQNGTVTPGENGSPAAVSGGETSPNRRTSTLLRAGNLAKLQTNGGATVDPRFPPSLADINAIELKKRETVRTWRRQLDQSGTDDPPPGPPELYEDVTSPTIDDTRSWLECNDKANYMVSAPPATVGWINCSAMHEQMRDVLRLQSNKSFLAHSWGESGCCGIYGEKVISSGAEAMAQVQLITHAVKKKLFGPTIVYEVISGSKSKPVAAIGDGIVTFVAAGQTCTASQLVSALSSTTGSSPTVLRAVSTSTAPYDEHNAPMFPRSATNPVTFTIEGGPHHDLQVLCIYFDGSKAAVCFKYPFAGSLAFAVWLCSRKHQNG